MTESFTYSLWLQPTGDIAYRLQERIKKLSQKHQTPFFAPHVTLLGGLSFSQTEITSLTDTLASSLQPFELLLTKAGYRNEYYQSLFIYVKESGKLKELRKIACQMFDIENKEFMPHLSLLYGDLSQKEKERILNIIGREFHIRFPVSSIAVMQTNGKPNQWKKVHSSVFRL